MSLLRANKRGNVIMRPNTEAPIKKNEKLALPLIESLFMLASYGDGY